MSKSFQKLLCSQMNGRGDQVSVHSQVGPNTKVPMLPGHAAHLRSASTQAHTPTHIHPPPTHTHTRVSMGLSDPFKYKDGSGSHLRLLCATVWPRVAVGVHSEQPPCTFAGRGVCAGMPDPPITESGARKGWPAERPGLCWESGWDTCGCLSLSPRSARPGSSPSLSARALAFLTARCVCRQAISQRETPASRRQARKVLGGRRSVAPAYLVCGRR